MDFKAIIEELQEAGLAEREIARLCGGSQSSIRNIRDRGGEPRWTLGDSLIKLHRKTMKKMRERWAA